MVELTSFHGDCPDCDVTRGRFMSLADYRDRARLATWLHHVRHLYRPHSRHHAFGPGAWRPYGDGFLYTRPRLCTPNTTIGSLSVRRVRAPSAEAAARTVDSAELDKDGVSRGVYLQTAGPYSSYCTCIPCVKKSKRSVSPVADGGERTR